MLIGRFLLLNLIFSTFVFAAITTNLTNNSHPIQSSTITTDKSNKHSELPIQTIQSFQLAANKNECHESCSMDYCLKYESLNKNCTRLIRDECNCCTVCLRAENETCGGQFNVYGFCEQDLFCYKFNQTENESTDSIGICIKACWKFQCLLLTVNNKTTCECANRRIPCDANLHQNKINNNDLIHRDCEQQTIKEQERELSLLKSNGASDIINCSSVICNTINTAKTNTSICPTDSHYVVNHTLVTRTSSLSIKNLSSICCESGGRCVCSTCPKTICGENLIIQIYRTGNSNIPGQCCDQFSCISKPKQCQHDKRFYNENETWSIDHCTTCTCRGGHADCSMIQCPTYSHCGYMYKPENECCPICGGCLNDRFHVQHMNSTWIESNGCMKCWCENGRTRCFAEGCIGPHCENPRQIANVCCPVCDDSENQNSTTIATTNPSVPPATTPYCPELDQCSLVCEHGLAKDEHGCLQCACSTMSCPSPLCTLKFGPSSKQYCSCTSPDHLGCGQLNCDKHCPYNYTIDQDTNCMTCECNSCPLLICNKNCTYGLKQNDVGCPICVCESSIIITSSTKPTDLQILSWPKRCYSGSSSYSNGEIWFDGCRQCLCHKGEQLCALISCPAPKCAQPTLLPNHCCPSCPENSMVPEPIPSPQVCYASQYVTGEELEFDKCTKCICLHNIAFCSISLCPPLECSSTKYEPSLCCPTCPVNNSETLPTEFVSGTDAEFCVLDDGTTKYVGELWKANDCKSCLCPRSGTREIQCFSQRCEQNLTCSNPVLKKGQCCPFCLPSTAAVAVCIFNYVQYRSGEHWNVSDCHHCECLHGTIVCHQYQCPPLNCTDPITLNGHCCPICHGRLSTSSIGGSFSISQSSIVLLIIVVFPVLFLILLTVIIILLYIILRGKRGSLSSSDQLSSGHHLSSKISATPTANTSKPSNTFPYVKYDSISIRNENSKQVSSSSSNIPLTLLEQTSTHSIIGTNTTITGTSSSNNELENNTWTEDDPMLQCSANSSNGDEEEGEEHEIIISDNDESQNQSHLLGVPPTIIYV